MNAIGDRQEILRRSTALVDEERFAENEELLVSALERFPDDAELCARAASATHMRDPEEAARLAMRAAELAGNDPTILGAAAHTLFLAERYAEARDLTVQAVSTTPEDSLLMASLANLSGRLALVAGKHEKAEELFRQAFEMDPAGVGHGRAYAELLEETGREAEALKVVEAALRDTEGEPSLVEMRERLRADGTP